MNKNADRNYEAKGDKEWWLTEAALSEWTVIQFISSNSLSDTWNKKKTHLNQFSFYDHVLTTFESDRWTLYALEMMYTSNIFSSHTGIEFT